MYSMGTLPEIARWWRRESGKQSSSRRGGCVIEEGVQSTNPQTLLLEVMRSEEGRIFARERVDTLKRELRWSDDPEKRCLLALYLEKMGEEHLQEAAKEMEVALGLLARRHASQPSRGIGGSRLVDLSTTKGGGLASWALGERVRLNKACRALEIRKKALLTGTVTSNRQCPKAVFQKERTQDGSRVWSDGSWKEGVEEKEGEVKFDCEVGEDERHNQCRAHSGPILEPVVERDTSMEYDEFVKCFSSPGIPVVIKGGARLCFTKGQPWGREELKKHAGSK
ncbi:unnamed protein product, partial [Choristocarpus tenellus]